MHISLNAVLKFMVIYGIATSIGSPACQMQLSAVCLKEVIKARRMRWKGPMERKGGRRITYVVWVGGGTPEGKKPAARSRRRWEDNIK